MEEDCEPSRGEVRDSMVVTTPTTNDIEEVVTSVRANLRRIVTPVTTTSGNANTLVIAYSTTII